MKASILDLRRRMSDVLRALERNEPVTILYRGKEKGILYPSTTQKVHRGAIAEHTAFGMWKDHNDMQDVGQYVRNLRKGRHYAV